MMFSVAAAFCGGLFDRLTACICSVTFQQCLNCTSIRCRMLCVAPSRQLADAQVLYCCIALAEMVHSPSCYWRRDLRYCTPALQPHRWCVVSAVNGVVTCRYFFQGVHMLLSFGCSAAGMGKPWGPSEKRVNKLVFIGRNLDRTELNNDFRACLASSAA